MLTKVETALCRAYLKARMAIMQFEQEERGDAVQTIIVIGIGVIIAALLYTFLVGSEKNEDGTPSGGVIGTIFGNITEKISNIFGG